MASVERLLDRLAHALEQVGVEFLELGAAEGALQVQRGAGFGVEGDERQADAGVGGVAQLDLGLLGRLDQALKGLGVFAKVEVVLFLELVGQPVDDVLVEVVAAQVGVAGGGLDFEHAVAEFQDGHVEGAAAQVEDQHGFVALALQPVGERGGGGFVDDAQHVETRDFTGLTGGLALRVVEVGRNRDHDVLDLLAELGRGVVDQFTQHFGADLLGGQVLAVDFDTHAAAGAFLDFEGAAGGFLAHFVPTAANKALDGEQGGLRVERGLAAGDLADQALLTFVGDNRRRGARALGVDDHFGASAFHDRDDAVGGSQIDSDCFWHVDLTMGNSVRMTRNSSERLPS